MIFSDLFKNEKLSTIHIGIGKTAFLGLLFIFFGGCERPKTCELIVGEFDYSESYEETLKFGFCNLDPNYFQQEVSGTLEGDILLQEFYKLSGKGEIDTVIMGDYYADKFVFDYRPLGEVSGDLEFKISLR